MDGVEIVHHQETGKEGSQVWWPMAVIPAIPAVKISSLSPASIAYRVQGHLELQETPLRENKGLGERKETLLCVPDNTQVKSILLLNASHTSPLLSRDRKCSKILPDHRKTVRRFYRSGG